VRPPAVRRRRVRPGGPHEPSPLTPREADSGVRRRGEGCGRGGALPAAATRQHGGVEALPGGYDQHRRRRRGGGRRGGGGLGWVVGDGGGRSVGVAVAHEPCARSTPPGWPSSAAPWPSYQPAAAGGLPPAPFLGRDSPRVQRCGGCVRSVHACSTRAPLTPRARVALGWPGRAFLLLSREPHAKGKGDASAKNHGDFS
jgi:hypothetical protein